jgi:phage gp37-like protein
MRYCFLAAAMLMFLFSCKKKEDSFSPGEDPYRNLCPVGYDEHILTGKWRQTVTYNGYTGERESASPNEYTVLTLNENKTYTVMVNGQVTRAGSYDTATLVTQIWQTKQLALFFDTNVTPMIVSTFHDSLSLAADAYDAGGTLYRRDCR